MKVKGFVSHIGIETLENRINKFIQNENITVLNINFAVSWGSYSALVEYEEK
jgi:hypothetical protein